MESQKPLLKENPLSFLDDIADMTKSALYRIAQILKIPGRSTMTKEELLSALEHKKGNTLTGAVSSQVSPKNEIPVKPVQPTGTFEEKQMALPDEKRTLTSEPISSVHIETPSVPIAAPSHGTVWMGEEGPDLPNEYGKTLLQAMPRDPHWAYVYWEISEETKQQIRAEEGDWIFDISETVLRVYSEGRDLFREIPILLDAMNWYVPLPAGRNYEFELGLKKGEGLYRVLARSNRITLPPAEPSSATDEEWAIVQEKYEEMMQLSGGISLASWGGSAAFMPHVLRHRQRLPWSVPAPVLSSWPSSHILGISSSELIEKK